MTNGREKSTRRRHYTRKRFSERSSYSRDETKLKYVIARWGIFFFSNILCRGNPIFTNSESPTVNSFVFNDLGQYSFATAYSAASVSSTNRASPAPLRRVRWIENDRFWVSTKSPWNLFIRCVNVRTNPLDSLFTDDRRVIELTARNPKENVQIDGTVIKWQLLVNEKNESQNQLSRPTLRAERTRQTAAREKGWRYEQTNNRCASKSAIIK